LQAEKHNLPSIAIPAISTGVFGGNVRTCTKIIVQAINSYFLETTASQIEKVRVLQQNVSQLFFNKRIAYHSIVLPSIYFDQVNELATQSKPGLLVSFVVCVKNIVPSKSATKTSKWR